MTAVSSLSDQSSIAPVDFDIYHSFEDTNDIISVAVENCQLCGSTRNPFHCQKCVRGGYFCRADEQKSYGDKMCALQLLRKKRAETLSKLQAVVQQQLKIKQKISAIADTRQHTELLSKAINEASAQEKKGRELLSSRQHLNESVTARLHQLSNRQSRISEHIAKLQRAIDGKKRDLAASNHQVCLLRQQHVQQLVEHIFTITRIQTQSDMESSYYVSELSEARHTAYIKGRWVFTDTGSEPKYRIVYPTLPADNDYASYINWVCDSSLDCTAGGVYPVTGQTQLTDSIEAALTYVAQLVMLLAYFLDVNLTQKISYCSLHKHTQTRSRFIGFMSRLNDNILQLCLSQNVATPDLNVKDPVHNLLLLLKAPSLGRWQSVVVDCETILHLESQVARDPDQDSVETSDDDDDADQAAGAECVPDHDWERVPMFGDPGLELPWRSEAPENDDSLVVHAADAGTAPSVVGAIMSSAAASVSSIWRAATWKK